LAELQRFHLPLPLLPHLPLVVLQPVEARAVARQVEVRRVPVDHQAVVLPAVLEAPAVVLVVLVAPAVTRELTRMRGHQVLTLLAQAEATTMPATAA
jgi:hypothetical protein